MFYFGADYYPEHWPEERWNGDQRLLFILNHSDNEQVIQLDRRYSDLITGNTVQDHIAIPPTDLALLAA